ncbi:MAG: pyruvate, phosphate dikinase [Rhodobacteraceae bacterium]|nr:pyruvate, phosphate dikinase [Paracoccaceae bacterium]
MKPQEIIRDPNDGVVSLDAGGAVRETAFGRRAWKLARLMSLGLPIPPGFALSFECVRELAGAGPMPDLPGIEAPGRLLVLRCSPLERAWGGVPSLRNIGIGERSLPVLEARFGTAAALDVYRRFIGEFSMTVHGMDPDDFRALGPEAADGADAVALRGLIDEMLQFYADEVGDPFPQDPRVQLELAARAMARMWNAPSARILREAKGAPADAGLGLIVQEAAAGTGAGIYGRGDVQLVDSRTGKKACVGSFRLIDPEKPTRVREIPLAAPAEGVPTDGPTLDELCPEALRQLRRAAMRTAEGLGDAYRLLFAIRAGQVAVLDALPVRRTARAAVQISVDLAKSGAITRSRALLQVDPRSLIEHLHPQIAPNAVRDVFGLGLAASPGAATGRIVFTAEAAQAAAAQDEHSILVRVETGPEDIRGMHSAHGVLTIRGGMTSHAAVIARGIGLPCVVGASDLRLDFSERTLTTSDGRVIREGALVTLDGTRGEVMAGAVEMIAPELGGAFSELLDWADTVRDLGVRANADTPSDARTAREFRVDGIGLCRTEHMFFDENRIAVMREMILANSDTERQAALDRLLPMQRADFVEIFDIMRGLPVTIRLLDPPLHEFLPNGPEEIAEFAEAMGLPVAQITARARELSEVNPMLGMRGVRLGITMPAIYDMQARAIFEAAVEVNRDSRAPVVPEVMIPLVSANREVELVKRRIDAIAEDVQREQGAELTYKLGVMVETPRAALRAGDLAATSAFLSFGTNDLTQMTYGLSRDDAGRFMRDYVNQGVFPEDPFHTLDVEGVGELMLIAARRGRATNPGLTLGLCGEHGGDPSSVRFCKVAGFDYVSCSPFRVPIARLAAAQATLLSRSSMESGETRR